MLISGFEHVFFDMDGVLIDSNEMKINAAKAVTDAVFPSAATEFSEYFRRNFGRTRREHFEFCYDIFLKKNGFSAEIIDRLVADYAFLVNRQYNDCAICEGVFELIQSIYVPKYVVTGGDQLEAKNTLTAHDLNGHFQAILGSPTRKTENINALISEHGIDPKNAVLVGDSSSDFLSAKECELNFILVTKYIGFDSAALIKEVLSSKGKVVNSLLELLPQ